VELFSKANVGGISEHASHIGVTRTGRYLGAESALRRHLQSGYELDTTSSAAHSRRVRGQCLGDVLIVRVNASRRRWSCSSNPLPPYLVVNHVYAGWDSQQHKMQTLI